MDTEENKTHDESDELNPSQETAITDKEEQAEPAVEQQEASEQAPKVDTGFKAKLHAWKNAYFKHKKITIPATVLLLVVLLLGVPATRYPILGIGIKKDYTVTIVDTKTSKPISSVDLAIGGKTAKTGQDGKATFSKLPVGNYQLKATKKYYKDATSSVLVSLKGGASTLKLDATGRQVKLKVTNKFSLQGVSNAQVSAAGTEVKTDDNGEATIVLPADNDIQSVTINKDGYLHLLGAIHVVESDAVDISNNYAMVPSGQVYFLSKRTGKINVMKSNLDGGEAKVVLAATGGEDDGDTILLASQDWKYLALKSKRNGASKPASLYLIDTTNGDKLTTMDEGDATFTLTGWSGHTFVYQVQRDKVQYWQPSKYSIKSYDAEANKLNTLDNTSGEGTGTSSYSGTDYKAEYYTSPILVGDTVNYGKSWSAGIYTSDGSFLAGKQAGIYSVKVNGQDKKTLKSFDATKYSSMESKSYKPKEIYYRLYLNSGANSEFYEVDNGAIQTKGDLNSQFYLPYPTYLYDPSNKQTFWSESRDGKNTLFIGDDEGSNGKTIAELSDYTTYGWFTDDYVLVSKNSSELYIMGAGGLNAGQTPYKITDYHKPTTTFYGYGGGYGGL